MIPTHNVSSLDVPTDSKQENLNTFDVINDVADFISKLKNPDTVRQFYQEYSQLGKSPRSMEILESYSPWIEIQFKNL